MLNVYSLLKPCVIQEKKTKAGLPPVLQRRHLSFAPDNPYDLLDGIGCKLHASAGKPEHLLLRSRSEQGLHRFMEALELSPGKLQASLPGSLFAMHYIGHRGGNIGKYALCFGSEPATGIHTLCLQAAEPRLFASAWSRMLRKPLDRWYYQMEAMGMDVQLHVERKQRGAIDATYVMNLAGNMKPRLLTQLLHLQHKTATEALSLLRCVHPSEADEQPLLLPSEEPLHRGRIQQHWAQVFRKVQSPDRICYFGAGLFAEAGRLRIEFKLSCRYHV